MRQQETAAQEQPTSPQPSSSELVAAAEAVNELAETPKADRPHDESHKPEDHAKYQGGFCPLRRELVRISK